MQFRHKKTHFVKENARALAYIELKLYLCTLFIIIKMKRFFILWIAFMAITVAGANAQEPQQPRRVPAYPGIIERLQPDGSTLRLYLRGDERMHWVMTEDGWQLFEDDRGWLKYAKTNRRGKAVISCRKAHNIGQRSKCENKWLEKHGVKKL